MILYFFTNSQYKAIGKPQSEQGAEPRFRLLVKLPGSNTPQGRARRQGESARAGLEELLSPSQEDKLQRQREGGTQRERQRVMSDSKSIVIDEEQVKKIATLSRLTIPEERVAQLSERLTQILSYAEKLNEVDTEGVEPLSHVHGAVNVYRDDVSEEYENKEQILANVPDRSGAFIKVPLIIDQESH